VYKEIGAFKQHLVAPPLHHALLVGGVDSRGQEQDLRDGCDIVVGTPGRLVDMWERKRLDLSAVKFFVLDEADRLMDDGTLPAIMKVAQVEVAVEVEVASSLLSCLPVHFFLASCERFYD
jgi:superfamily II DNA/RNA helicase